MQVAYYGEPSMAPEIFIKAYASATPEEYQLSEEAPKIDAKNPAGMKAAFVRLFICHGPIITVEPRFNESLI